jgi:hypothetical protein
MTLWPHKKEVVCDEILCTNYQYQLIVPLKPKLITNHNLAVVRLPSYICEQNPIEFAYARIERLLENFIIAGMNPVYLYPSHCMQSVT